MEDVCQQMIKSGMTRKDIHSAVDKILDKICVCCPMIKVLYNESYGQFELNQDFISFAYKEQDKIVNNRTHVIKNNAERIFPAQYIESFGKHMALMYPNIACVVNNYYHYDMYNVYTTMNTIKKNPTRNYELITDLMSSMQIDKDMMSEMLRSLGEMREVECFYKALQQKNDHTVWYNDCGRYVTSITTFLHKKTSSNTTVSSDLLHRNNELPIHDRLYVDLGLLCAADNTCRLAIAHIQSSDDFYIESYNGKERILSDF